MQTISGKRGPRKPASSGVALSRLPSVARVLESPPIRRLIRQVGTFLATSVVREEIARLREEVRAGRLGDEDLRRASAVAAVARRARERAERVLEPSPRTVINATGVIVHTNLGRSMLSAEAAARAAEAATAYLDLEYDLEHGHRGNRLAHLAPLMERLFPGSGFVVLNNNAAAILVTLRALARRKEVVVSRGELVEIGGSFRVPDILAASGARLREVGTTNRTRRSDYEAVLGARTGALLKVHTSNFAIVGFTGEASVPELAALAHGRDLPLIVDWGSGDLIDLAPLGILDEQPVGALLERGADVVTFSGDKLLGGPQAGFVVGRPELVERIRRDPLARVCRIDRLRVGALRETLAAHLTGRALRDVPTLAMLALSADAVGRRARRVLREVARRTGRRADLEVVEGVSRTGGGSSPAGERPTRLLAVRGKDDADARRLERALRRGRPAVVARVHQGRVLLDLRTVLPAQDEVLVERLSAALGRKPRLRRKGTV